MLLFYVWLWLYIQTSNAQTVPTVKYIKAESDTTISTQEIKPSTQVIPIDYECSMRNAISTIVIKKNNLIDICDLGKEYQVYFKIFIKKFQFKKTILNIFGGQSKKKKILTIKSAGRAQKLKFTGIIDEFEEKFKATTKQKVQLEIWNKIKIVQEEVQGGFVSNPLC